MADELDKAYTPSDKDYKNTLLNIALLGGGAKLAQQALPRSYGREIANMSSNFLKGFYQKGIGELGKAKLYAEEFARANVRLAKTALNPVEAIAYKNTGISTYLEDTIDRMKGELRQVDRDYVEGKYGEKGETAIKRAKQEKGRIIKERHYKALNDSANRYIFDGKRSKPLEDYRTRAGGSGLTKDYFYKSNYNEFLDKAATGNSEKARYILDRHDVGKYKGVRGLALKQPLGNVNPNNVGFLRWTDNNISGVLRGAQFNFKTYQILDTLKKGRFSQGNALSALQTARYSPRLLSNGKILFNFSPSWKSNFDWGGYNVVAEWDYKKPGKVRFIGTDLRDTPASPMFKGRHVLNYVESKEIDIKSMEEEVDKRTKPRLVSSKKEPIKRKPKLSDLERRQNLVKTGGLRMGSVYDNMINQLGKVSTTKKRSKNRQRNILKQAKKLQLGKAYKSLSKAAMKYGKGAGTVIGAGMLAASALANSETLKDMFDD